VSGRRPAFPFGAGPQSEVDFFERSEKSGKRVLEMFRPPAPLTEITVTELVRIGDNGRAQRAVFVRALGPSRTVRAIDPECETH
jgi:hypothetical protein